MHLFCAHVGAHGILIQLLFGIKSPWTSGDASAVGKHATGRAVQIDITIVAENVLPVKYPVLT